MIIDYGSEKFDFCGREITINQYRDMIDNLDIDIFPIPLCEGNKIKWIYPKAMCKNKFEETTEDVQIDEDGNRCCIMCSKITDEERGDSDNACAECN